MLLSVEARVLTRVLRLAEQDGAEHPRALEQINERVPSRNL
jgi:hypothetical protein